jgi:hypothetical protein
MPPPPAPSYDYVREVFIRHDADGSGEPDLASSHLVSSHLISSHRISSHLI